MEGAMLAMVAYTADRGPVLINEVEDPRVKKILVLVLLALGAFAVWRKVQSDRAELDLWTEATAIDQD
jgi:uncharacterized membrane protein YfcA